MKGKKALDVYMHEKHVGTLAETKEHIVAFEYSDEWLNDGFSISPMSVSYTHLDVYKRQYSYRWRL